MPQTADSATLFSYLVNLHIVNEQLGEFISVKCVHANLESPYLLATISQTGNVITEGIFQSVQLPLQLLGFYIFLY